MILKLNFFSRIYLAITDFRLYPFVVQKEKFITAFAYFLAFIILISIILSANATVKILNWVENFVIDYYSQVNDYVISDGVFKAEKNTEIDFQGVKFMTDDSKNSSEVLIDNNELQNHKLLLIAYRDAFVVANKNVGLITFKYSDLDLDLDKAILYKGLTTALNSWAFKLSLAGIIFCGVFIAYFFTKFFNVIGITLMLLFLGMVFRTKYKFKDYMKAAFYIITLPIITELIAFIIVGELNEYANITYYLLSYVYMFYAIRALKLDNIIISTQEKIMSMKNESEIASDMLSGGKPGTEDNEDKTKEQKENNSEKKDTEKGENKKEDK